MTRTEAMRLMTWRRSCPLLFPYGSSIVPMLCTFLLMEAPSIALLYHLLAYHLLPPLFPALLILFNLFALTSMAATVYTDPGILPQMVNNYEWSQQLLELPGVNHQLRPDHSYLCVGGWGLGVLQKYCVECHIYRPLRAIHCRTCNHCVERYDHHCPWLGVCIGKYNYRFFLAFLVSLNLLVLGMFGCSVAVVVDGVVEGRGVLSYLLEIIEGVLGLGFGLALLKLFSYHVELISCGLTTNEDLKDIYKPIGGMVPFSRCTPDHPPVLDLKGRLVKGSDLEVSMDEPARRSVDPLNKGKRYSTLVSDRQSVLNSLVDGEL